MHLTPLEFNEQNIRSNRASNWFMWQVKQSDGCRLMMMKAMMPGPVQRVKVNKQGASSVSPPMFGSGK